MHPEAEGRRRQLGRYELIARIGRGGMAEVQLARLRGAMGFEKLVVVKLIHEHLASRKSFVEMLMQEARLAALIKHPSVVDIYDLGESDGRYFIAMEYLAGEPLLAVLRAGREGPRLDPLSTGRIIADVAEGLSAAHQLRLMTGEAMPVVHHDISLGNIMVLYTGQAKLVDFGVAKAGDKTPEDRDRVKGKFAYMAPEKMRGEGGDARSDVFSLGVVLWEALTLRRLFRADSDLDAIEQVLREPIPRPSAVNHDVPAAFDRICERALEREVSRRYQTAAELATDIESVLKEAAYSAKYETIAQYMQQTFEVHIAARTQLIKEAATVNGPSDQLVTAAFAPSEGGSMPPLRGPDEATMEGLVIDPEASLPRSPARKAPEDPKAATPREGPGATAVKDASSLALQPPVLPAGPLPARTTSKLAAMWPEKERSVTEVTAPSWPEPASADGAAVASSAISSAVTSSVTGSGAGVPAPPVLPTRAAAAQGIPALFAPGSAKTPPISGGGIKSASIPVIPMRVAKATQPPIPRRAAPLLVEENEPTEVTTAPTPKMTGAHALVAGPPDARPLAAASEITETQRTSPIAEASGGPAAEKTDVAAIIDSQNSGGTVSGEVAAPWPVKEPKAGNQVAPSTTQPSGAPDLASRSQGAGDSTPASGDVLNGWGWSTDSVTAISDSSSSIGSAGQQRRKTLWLAGGGGALALAILVAVLASGSEPASPAAQSGADDAASSTFPGAARADHIALAPELTASATVTPTATPTTALATPTPTPTPATTPPLTRTTPPPSKAPEAPDAAPESLEPPSDPSPPAAAQVPAPAPPERPARESSRAPDREADRKKRPDVDVEATYKAGQSEFLRGDARGALSTFRKVLAASPGFAPAWRGSALALERLGQKSAAARAWRRYLKLAPNGSDAAQVRTRLEKLE